MRLVRGVGDEAGAGFRVPVGARLEELKRAHPVDDEFDADDEDKEAHNSYDRADAVAPSLSIQGVP